MGKILILRSYDFEYLRFNNILNYATENQRIDK